ncbi:unnamed protein product [Lactuca saligna]|uniref:Uncharacterized protein n=1 Tax=Lactuca saligna TaxID=75948 RepID=A0AA35VMC5_LACSI|nr:unnamed protein product [Lactuca saligna]
MVLKRPSGQREEDDYEANHQAKQRFASSNFVRNIMQGISSQEFASSLEPLIRGWVREEVQRACHSFCCSSPRSPFNAFEPCETTSLQLRFQTKLPQMLFTGSRVESEDNTPVRLVLFNTDSNKIVTSGPYSSLKIQIVPLDGDFCYDEEEDWSQKDFEAKIIQARDGKRPLVAGDLVVVLKDGIGDLGEVYFTDNSSWRRNRKFRIGAVANSGVRIREARSEAFVVKDHRGESYKKHHPPCLSDDVWRLEKIAKDGAFHKRLGVNRIRTVKDFLQMYFANESSLRKILGGSCNKTWETIIKHAKACVLDDKLYMYEVDGIGLLFNSVFTVVGATFDGQNYLPLEKLAGIQKPLVESLKQQFHKSLDRMLPVEDVSVFGPAILTSSFTDLPQMQLTLPYEFEYNNQSEVHSSMQLFSPNVRNNFMLREFSNGPYGEGYSSGPSTLSGQAAGDYDFQFGALLWPGIEPSDSPFNQIVGRNGSPTPKGRWCKIRAAVKWVSVMRDVTAKRMAEMYPYLDFSS